MLVGLVLGQARRAGAIGISVEHSLVGQEAEAGLGARNSRERSDTAASASL